MNELEKLVAQGEIRELKARYFRAIDEKDEALLRETFSENVELDYRGSTSDPESGANAVSDATAEVLRGRDASVPRLIATLNGIASSVHHASEPEIEIIDAQNAKAIWPMVDRLKFLAGGPFKEMVGYGHYRETYIKEQGRWRINTMRLTRLRVDFTPC